MNIILQVKSDFQPDHQGFVWPPRNGDPGQDKGVEQDFYQWATTQDYHFEDGDWAYLPIYWNRYYINNQWGEGGIPELQAEIDRCREVADQDGAKRWFTVCEYDLRALQPQLNLHGLVVFSSSRRKKETVFADLPLLSAPHPLGEFDISNKRWKACFLGHMQTDGIRIKMGEVLEDRRDCFIKHGNDGPDVYRDIIRQSYIALAPRGQGAQSYRFYESMQLGTVPLYISDIDCRPFKEWINWDLCSLYRLNVDGLSEYLDSFDGMTLMRMGLTARAVYNEQLAYGKWCQYVIRTLEQL